MASTTGNRFIRSPWHAMGPSGAEMALLRVGSGVVVQRDRRRDGVRLTCQHDASSNLLGLECIVAVHPDLTLDQAGSTGAAHTAGAAERRIRPGAQRRSQDRLVA